MANGSKDALETLESLRDIGDFCIAWPQLRPFVSAERIGASDLPEDGKEVVRWLCLLADKVAEHPI